MNNNSINGSISTGRGQLGLCLYNSPSADIDLNSTFSQFYNKYVLDPSLNINCVLPTIGTLSNNVNQGYELYICNVSAFQINITTISLILRPNSIVHLVANSPGNWTILQKYNSSNAINSDNGAPSILATDLSGDLYIDKSVGNMYIFDGAAWNILAAASVNVDNLSIQGAGTLVNPYSTLTNMNSQTSAQATIKDKTLMINSSSQILANKSISYQSTVSNNINSYQYNGVLVDEYTNNDNFVYYNPENDTTTESMTVNTGSITIGPTLSGTNVTLSAGSYFTILVKKDNYGNLLWVVKIDGQARILGFYYEPSTGITWVVHNYYFASSVYDYSDLTTPIVILPKSTGGSLLSSCLTCFDSNGYYVGSTTTPYVIDSGGSSTCEFNSVIGDNSGSIYVGMLLNPSATYTFNRYNDPPGSLYSFTATGTGGVQPSGVLAWAKFNTTTRLYEWTSYSNNSAPGFLSNNGTGRISNLMIPNLNLTSYQSVAPFITAAGTFAGTEIKSGADFMNIGNITYQNGTTINSPIYLPCNGSPSMSRICMSFDATTGLPVWLNASLLNTDDNFYNSWAPCVTYDEQNYLTYAVPFQNSISQIYLIKQQEIEVSLTNASNAVTSAGLFLPGMDGMMIYGYGIPSGTRFTYVDINNGILSNNATFTYGSGASANPSKVLISNQVNIVSIATNATLAAVTSAEGLFTSSMNGQQVFGPNVADGTVFSFVDANNGTLSVPAAITGTDNHYIGNTANRYNNVTTASYGLLGAKIDTNGNFVWAKALCTSPAIPSMYARLCVDRYNNIFYSGGAVSVITFTNGDVVNTNQAFISKFDPSGNVIYTKSYNNGNALFMVQVNEKMYLWHFYVVGSLVLDGTTFPTNSSLIRVFMIENDNKKLGLALENLGLVATKYANNGVITTTNPLDVSKVYYTSQSDGSLIDSNIYDLVPIGVAINSTKLLLY